MHELVPDFEEGKIMEEINDIIGVSRRILEAIEKVVQSFNGVEAGKDLSILTEVNKIVMHVLLQF